jgi:hypothetical protein
VFYLGSIVSFIGAIWIIVNAFRNDGLLWGIGSLLCGPAMLVYAIMNFDANKIPLALFVVGIIISVMGGMPSDLAAQMPTG